MVKIFGKEVDVTYYVNESRGLDGKLKCKPSLVSKKGKAKELYVKSELASDIPTGVSFVTIGKKQYGVLRWEYDADNGVAVLVTDYVEENSVDKEVCESRLEALLKEWNAQVINASPQMSAWCKLHDKNPEDVDVDELKKLFQGQGPEYVTLSNDCFTVYNGSNVGLSAGSIHNLGQHTHSIG